MEIDQEALHRENPVEDRLDQTLKSISSPLKLSEKTGLSFRRQILPKNIINTQRFDNGTGGMTGRYSFQRRDDQMEVGGGRINGANKGFFASDLNSVITESRNMRAKQSFNN